MALCEIDEMVVEICQKLDEFCKPFQEKVDIKQQQSKALKINADKLLHEMNKHFKLMEKLASNRCTEIKPWLPAGPLTISDNDQKRLDQTRRPKGDRPPFCLLNGVARRGTSTLSAYRTWLCYEVTKELSGDFDFSAPPNVCKGYMKSEPRVLLQPFNMEADADTQAPLWRLAEAAAAPEWGLDDKEDPSTN